MAAPSTEALRHSQKLIHFILTHMQQKGGMLSFEEYMHLALYAPGLGYYHTGTQKLGAQGDFVTAPEISPLFSYCLAKQCQDVFTALPGNTQYFILEIGAGSGQMAVDILTQLEKDHCVPQCYYILEPSPDLKQRQQQKIQALRPKGFDKVQWIDQLPETPFSGIILANEVLDAMPVHIFKNISGVLKEQMIIRSKNPTSDKTFDYHYKTPSPELSIELEALCNNTGINLSEGYTSEINLHIKPWIQSLSQCLETGIILLIDYGFSQQEYYHPDRKMGTLMCHYQHKAHTDPFFHPGLQDITAHVDFAAVAEAALLAELDVLGYTHQAAFLLSCGLLDFVKEQNFRIKKDINTLTSPAEMGELFKVIALGKGLDIELLGFKMSNRLFSL